MANYANFAFRFRSGIFFIDSDFSICSSGRVKIVGAPDFRIFKRGLAPIARKDRNGAQRNEDLQ